MSYGDYKKKDTFLRLKDFAGGKNSAQLAHAIRENQVQECCNVNLDPGGGATRGKGLWGLASTAQGTGHSRGLFVHRMSDGTSQLVWVNNQGLYSVNTSTGALTLIYAIGGDGQAYGFNFMGRLFVANGTDVAKVEGASGYKVGIAAPTGATASAVAGGSLPVGTYYVAVSYARKVGGDNALYSVPQLIGTVNVTSGNQTIRVSCANSADPQVNNKVIWLTDAGLTTPYYFYHETDDNTTTSIDVDSNSDRNTDLVMSVRASDNYRPGAFVQCALLNRCMWGFTANSNRLWKSRQAGTVYDIECFPAANYVDLQANIESIFPLGEHMYINTSHGLIMLPYGDLTSEPIWVDQRLRFKYARTMVEHKGVVFGLTNDGIRLFDGQRFSIDVSKDIKPDVDKIISGNSSDFEPVSVIHRESGKRTEVQFGYRDTTKSSTVHTTRIVLNLDSLAIQDELNYRAAWESHDTGFSHAVDYDGVLYVAQSHATSSLVAKLQTYDVTDKYVYSNAAAFLSSATAKRARIVSRIFVPDIIGMCEWDHGVVLCQSAITSTLRVVIPDFGYYTSEADITTEGQGNLARLNTSETLLNFYLPTFAPLAIPYRVDHKSNGKMVYIEYEQTADDPNWALFEILLSGTIERSNYS